VECGLLRRRQRRRRLCVDTVRKLSTRRSLQTAANDDFDEVVFEDMSKRERRGVGLSCRCLAGRVEHRCDALKSTRSTPNQHRHERRRLCRSRRLASAQTDTTLTGPDSGQPRIIGEQVWAGPRRGLARQGSCASDYNRRRGSLSAFRLVCRCPIFAFV